MLFAKCFLALARSLPLKNDLLLRALRGDAQHEIEIRPRGHDLALYVDDLKFDGMLHARVLRPPSPGAHLNDAAAEGISTMPGVEQVVRDGDFLAVIDVRQGSPTWARVISTVPPSEIDVIIPIPESSRPSATQLAHLLGIPYREGFVKNRYVGRTFIMPGQGERMKSVKRKLNPIKLEFRNRVVLLVDDSIVRGTTSQQIVQMARDAGARKVYLASAAPPVRHPNIYGIDMPTPEELIAHGRTEDEIERMIGCDWLVYQDLADLEKAVAGPKFEGMKFDSSCFSGEYATGVDPGYFEGLRQLRSDDAKRQRRLAL